MRFFSISGLSCILSGTIFQLELEKEKFLKDPAIIHFTGKNKPWNHSKHPLRNEYFRYLKSTKWDK